MTATRADYLRAVSLISHGTGPIAVDAERASGFGMEVAFAGRGDDLHAALEQADVVSLHAPLTADTRHLVDPRAMKPGSPS